MIGAKVVGTPDQIHGPVDGSIPVGQAAGALGQGCQSNSENRDLLSRVIGTPASRRGDTLNCMIGQGGIAAQPYKSLIIEFL